MLQDVRSAAKDYKRSTSHTLKTLARDALAGDCDRDIRIERKPLGHADAATTIIYTNVLSFEQQLVRSIWDSSASTAAPNGR